MISPVPGTGVPHGVTGAFVFALWRYWAEPCSIEVSARPFAASVPRRMLEAPEEVANEGKWVIEEAASGFQQRTLADYPLAASGCWAVEEFPREAGGLNSGVMVTKMEHLKSYGYQQCSLLADQDFPAPSCATPHLLANMSGHLSQIQEYSNNSKNHNRIIVSTDYFGKEEDDDDSDDDPVSHEEDEDEDDEEDGYDHQHTDYSADSLQAPKMRHQELLSWGKAATCTVLLWALLGRKQVLPKNKASFSLGAAPRIEKLADRPRARKKMEIEGDVRCSTCTFFAGKLRGEKALRDDLLSEIEKHKVVASQAREELQRTKDELDAFVQMCADEVDSITRRLDNHAANVKAGTLPVSHIVQ